jgi:hypothetical protein
MLGCTPKAINKRMERVTDALRRGGVLPAGASPGSHHTRVAIAHWAMTSGPKGRGPLTRLDVEQLR